MGKLDALIGLALVAVFVAIAVVTTGSCQAIEPDCKWYRNYSSKDVPARCLKEFYGSPHP